MNDERPAIPATDPLTWGTPEGRHMIRLLWDPPTPAGRGPKQKLTLDQVVEAGMAVAAAEGVDKLSMRNVAAQLGVGAMSLYTYVPGRDELFELMIDRAWAARKLPDQSLPWREQVEFHAREAWAMYQSYPWLIRSNLWRMPLGPHVMDVAGRPLPRSPADGSPLARGGPRRRPRRVARLRGGPQRHHRHERVVQHRHHRRRVLGVAQQLLGHVLHAERFPDHDRDLGVREPSTGPPATRSSSASPASWTASSS